MHERWERKIDELFTGKLSEDEVEALHLHVRRCASCETLFERYARAERALFPVHSSQPQALTPFALERVMERMNAPVVLPQRNHGWMTAGLGLLATMGMTVLALRVDPGNGSVGRLIGTRIERLQARGHGEAARSAKVGLRALRARTGAGGVQLADLSAIGGDLGNGDRLKLLYTNLGHYRFVSVTAVAAGGRSTELVSQLEIRGGEDQVLGPSLVLPQDWPAGSFRLVALFSQSPSSAAPAAPNAKDGADQAVRIVEARFTPATAELGGRR